MVDSVQTTPESVLEAAFRAFREGDGRALAALATPESLREYRDAVLREASHQWKTWTVEDLLAHDPDMPVEVAEWRVSEMNRSREQHEEQQLARLPGTTSIADLETLSAAELVQRALHGMPGARALGFCRVLGQVMETDSRAYVLFQIGTEEETESGEYPTVAVVERSDGVWKLSLDASSPYIMPGFRNMYFVTDMDP